MRALLLRLGVLGVTASLAAMASDAIAAGEAASATLTCDASAKPGRVRCEVTATAPAGSQIRWGDVSVTSVPAFAAPLRGRISPHDASAHDDDLWRWPFALVAHERGDGTVSVRVHLVVCRDGKCEPQTLLVSGRLSVGVAPERR